jgi:hypothetical protein
VPNGLVRSDAAGVGSASDVPTVPTGVDRVDEAEQRGGLMESTLDMVRF